MFRWLSPPFVLASIRRHPAAAAQWGNGHIPRYMAHIWVGVNFMVLTTQSLVCQAFWSDTHRKKSWQALVSLFFSWGNVLCTMAPERTVWDSSTACQWVLLPVGQTCHLTYPLKPSYASEPGHIPLREVDRWTSIMIEIGKLLIHPEGSEFAPPIQSPTTIYSTCRYETTGSAVSWDLSWQDVFCFFFWLGERGEMHHAL